MYIYLNKINNRIEFQFIKFTLNKYTNKQNILFQIYIYI